MSLTLLVSLYRLFHKDLGYFWQNCRENDLCALAFLVLGVAKGLGRW